MQIENDYDKEVYNGDIGYVENIEPNDGELTAIFDGRSVIYGFGELDALVPAYAATIHKSQGSVRTSPMVEAARMAWLNGWREAETALHRRSLSSRKASATARRSEQLPTSAIRNAPAEAGTGRSNAAGFPQKTSSHRKNRFRQYSVRCAMMRKRV
jgi:hypothetical protein